MGDMTCLAEGVMLSTDSNKTGINLNEIVVGPTGCGKTWSNAYSRLVHTFDSSVVVPIAKSSLKNKFAAMFKARGYEVIDLDLAHPENVTVGYDPLDYIKRPEDVIQFSRNVIWGMNSDGKNAVGNDPYWNDSGMSVLSALVSLERLNAMHTNKKPRFANVVKLFRALRVETDDGVITTNLDCLFDEAELLYPDNQACELWKTVRGLATRTASCIFSVVNSALDKVFSDNIIKITENEDRIDFAQLGRKKTALFITTSPMNKTLQNYVNLFYADMFRILFEEAEKRAESRLEVPVHIICDDFACGSRIYNFEDYISIFRAAGLSVTLLLQSESQLSAMYGDKAATTIINNCDTYVYMGGMDIETTKHISERMDVPLSKVIKLPLEHVIAFRRGSEPIFGKRYQILNDPLYQEAMALNEQRNNNNKEGYDALR